VIVSDIRRDDQASGLDELESYVADGIFQGLAIFFTGRISASDRRRAKALGAAITVDVSELFAWLYKHAEALPGRDAGLPGN